MSKLIPMSNPLSAQEKWDLLKKELRSNLLTQLKGLQKATKELHSDCEAVMSRIRWEGIDGQYSDIRTGAMYRALTSIGEMQRVYRTLVALDQGIPPEVVKLEDASDEEEPSGV